VLTCWQDKLAQRGVEVTAEHKQKFLKIKEAYDVLSDPKRRRLYDQLGASGLKLMEHPTEVDPMTILRNYQVWRLSIFIR
jgi:DnaJ-class molecular chaperone